jgi:topoisomerase DNA binding C4 zinc finger
MAPAISEFPSKFIYNRLLKDNAEVINGKKKRDNDLVIKSAPLPGDALNLIDLAGTYCAADKNTDGSRFNILSAVISFSTAVKAKQNHIETIGIITPYAAQVRLIRAMLKDYYTNGTTNVSCATVHQFQGSESDVIVFDAVESYPKSAVGYLMGKEPNQVVRLINVAITRGKGKVITVANARFWENVFKGTNHIFYKLLQHIKNGKHQVIDNHDKTLQPYIESVNPGRMINIFMNEQDAISMFEQDMKKAKWQTVVSLPSGELRETEHQVFEILDEADSRGVYIKMKSNDYAKLPEQWKEYCVGTENATFPLIIIDDEVVWYGLPTAKWKFQVDKTTSMITVVHSMVRIKGKNTVEMIKALTDIETVVVGQNIRKLDNKKSKLVTNSFAASSGNLEDNGSILNYGLGAFVEEKEFCPKCKNHMILAKNARGTAYLKCSNKACKETKYLTVDLMNWYISSHNIKCPKRDGGELKGGLGKYGPYVRCNCGHFLKPDEI